MTVSDMPQHERPLSEQFRVVAKQYVAAKKQARFMERTRSATRDRMAARIMRESIGKEKITKAQAIFSVQISDEWMQYNLDLADAEEKADILFAQKEFIRLQQWEMTDANANIRTERKMR
jgi:hypothetical protein